ncbi:MAG: SDR family oxidoreductase, partial [Alphaproteobacteria bacterium]|nr:SDR family oxidoreductase [Alphaproteobacteria bacterium]
GILALTAEQDPEQTTLEEWQAVQKVNLDGVFLGCKYAIPLLRDSGGGSIVNFSGSYGNGTDPENNSNCIPVQYCAAKGAIRAFTMTVARDLAPYGIRVNAISPGMIEANWADDWGIDMDGEDMRAAFNSLSIRRLGVPEEIAETVLYLASDGSGYMTGQNLLVDGGWTMMG